MPNKITAGKGLFGALDVSKVGGLSIGGTAVTTTASQLNAVAILSSPSAQLDYLDVTPGTLSVGSAVVVDSSGKIDTLDITSLKIGGVTVTSSGAELNYLDVVAGTLSVGSAVVVDANGKINTLDITTPVFNGSTVSATATEINKLSGATPTTAQINTLAVTAGTLTAGSAVVVGATGKIDTLDITTPLFNGSTVSATATELNKLSGATPTTAQINTLAVTPGTRAAGSAVVLDADGKIDIMDVTTFYIGGSIVRGTGAELNYVASVTPGTLAIGSAVVVDASGKINTLDITTPLFNGATVTSSAAELNLLDGAGTIVNHVQGEITNAGTTATNLFTLPANSVPISFDVFVVTAFNDTGTDLLDVGVTGTGDHFINDADVSSTGKVTITTQAANWLTTVGASPVTVTATYTGASADSSDGTAIVSCLYKLS